MSRRPILLPCLSAMLAIASTALWVRSHWFHESVGLIGPVRGLTLDSMTGLLRVEFGQGATSTMHHGWQAHSEVISHDSHSRQFTLWSELDGVGVRGGFAGFAFRRIVSPTRTVYSCYAPHWSLILLLLPLPLQSFLLARRRLHRLKHNLCPTCAYDLRASKDRCPECGSPIPNSSHPSHDQVQSPS